MNEVGFCPVVGGVLSSGVLSCGVLSVWGFVLWGFVRTPSNCIKKLIFLTGFVALTSGDKCLVVLLH